MLNLIGDLINAINSESSQFSRNSRNFSNFGGGVPAHQQIIGTNSFPCLFFMNGMLSSLSGAIVQTMEFYI